MPYQPGLLRREDCLLVLIDIQERLLPVIWEKERVADNALKLARFAAIIGLPVLVTEQAKLGATIAPLSQEIQGFSPIEKITFDSFGCADFKRAVANSGRSTLLLAGIEAHICVTQTALTGLADYQVQVISDACSSRTAQNLGGGRGPAASGRRGDKQHGDGHIRVAGPGRHRRVQGHPAPW